MLFVIYHRVRRSVLGRFEINEMLFVMVALGALNVKDSVLGVDLTIENAIANRTEAMAVRIV